MLGTRTNVRTHALQNASAHQFYEFLSTNILRLNNKHVGMEQNRTKRVTQHRMTCDNEYSLSSIIADFINISFGAHI